MNLTFTSLIFILSAINGILFFLLALSKGKKDSNQYFLALLLILCSMMLFDEFSRWTKDFFYLFPQYAFVFTFAWFLIIPSIYLLVRHQVNRGYLKWYDLFHLIPLFIKIYMGEAYFASPEVKIMHLEANFQEHEAHDGKIIFGSQIVIYLTLIYFTLKHKYKFSGRQLFLKMSNWLLAIYIILILYFLTIIAIIFSVEIYGFHLRGLDIGKSFLFLFFVYGWLLYMIYNPKALKLPIKSLRIWVDHFDLKVLSPTLSNIIAKIKEDELFLVEDLQLYQLANALNVSGRHLTNLINEELKLNVPQLMNLLRIKEMENRFSQKRFQNYSLIGLAKSVGFKSKSSFYRSFKQFTGETPSSYFKKLGHE